MMDRFQKLVTDQALRLVKALPSMLAQTGHSSPAPQILGIEMSWCSDHVQHTSVRLNTGVHVVLDFVDGYYEANLPLSLQTTLNAAFAASELPVEAQVFPQTELEPEVAAGMSDMSHLLPDLDPNPLEGYVLGLVLPENTPITPRPEPKEPLNTGMYL